MPKYKTSEWVSLGHPDKCTDYISEYILDRLIEQDPKTRYALECQIKDYCVNLAGEITTSAQRTAYSRWVSEALNEIGYTKEYVEKFGEENTICGDRCVTSTFIREQSPDIARGVNESGWGDQGIFFGFYCDESDEGHGYDFYLAKKIGQALYNEALKSKTLGIDIKTQVTISTDETGEKTVEEVIVAIPMVSGMEKEGIKEVKEIIKTFCPANTPFIINGTGTYCKHGPIADSGTTGRKLVVDFYGGNSRIGGGCVDAETEYMSDNGWKKISEYDGGNVGQLTYNLELEMVKPEQYIDTYHDEIYEISTEKTTNMVLSGNHNVLYRTSKGHLQKKKVSQIIEESKDTKKGSHIDIPMTFTYGFMHGKKSNYDDTTSRIIVAHCADGSVIKDGVKWNCRIRVKKDYKVKRLRALFANSDISYEIREYADGFTYFYYKLNNTSKILSEQFCNPDRETAKMLTEEVFKWDGTEKYKEYRTTQKADADFIQFVLSGTTGKAHSICVHKKNDGYKECYVVRETKKTYSNPFRKIGKNKIDKKEPQKMYCFTVPSGMLLLRRNGYIFCTGNSPWTKDATKADLTLNLYAHDIAREYFKEMKKDGVPVARVETELSSCIGKTQVLIQVNAYDANGIVLFSDAQSRRVKPETLIKQYGLDKPVFAKLCRDGLFSIFNQSKKENVQ